MVDLLLNRIPAIFIIVNAQRQIVYMNKGALAFSRLSDVAEAIGKRPGELLGCIHSTEGLEGCGTGEHCTYCGAVNAILSSQNGTPDMRDARLFLGKDRKAYDLRIWAIELPLRGEKFTAITMSDIHHEKWQMFLERLFFHDILNTATSLSGTIMLLKDFKQKINTDELIERADVITQTLVDEIRSHQIILYAENDLLKINPITCNTIDLLVEISNFYAFYEIANGKTIQIDPASESIEITTDKTLLKRILGNMVKNALEATVLGDTITLGCNVLDGDQIRFTVNNPGFIPRDVQLQIFKRSFSTKSEDRGLGTYSMKLLSSFLNGEVYFETSEELGTTFIATYPLVVQPLEQADE